MNISERILEGIKEAMVTERTGIEFYRTAAERTRDEQGKAVFLRLAADEQKHLEYLRQQYQQLTKGTGSATPLELPEPGVDGTSPVFSSELKNRINQAHWEMTALSVGLALEQASIARYRQLAAQAEEEKLRRFFESLVRWEESHATALQQQFNFLREDYWREAGFAPF
uniref:Rubrerythrin diiron-binding domain-containing protein n=1 Tax=candidate division WOR-3 bacterium TaxID=2052148 RepID=A0A7C1X5N4_UNCW3